MKAGMKSWMVCSVTALALATWSGTAFGSIVGGSVVNLQAGAVATDPGNDVWSNSGTIGGSFEPDASTGTPQLGSLGGVPYYDHTTGESWGDAAGSSISIPLSSFTVESWIRTSGSPGSENQLWMLRSGAPQQRTGVFLRHNNEDGDGNLKWVTWENRVIDDSAGNRTFIGPNSGSGLNVHDLDLAVPQDEWFHLAVAFDNANDTASVWANGVQVANVTAGLGSVDFQTSSPFVENTVGIQNYLEGGGRAFQGYYNTFRIYDSALSGAEIVQNFNEGAFIPEPGTLALLSVGGLVLYLRRRRLQ